MSDQNLYKSRFSPALTWASLIIIIAGMMYAKSIITLVLLALFISVICAQPILWLGKRKVPHGFAMLIVLVGVVLLFFGIGELIGGSLKQFIADSPKYEATLNSMAASLIQSLNDRGLSISYEEISNMIDPGKIMRFTAGAITEVGGIMGNVFLIFFIVFFLLLELNSFSVKTKAIIKTPDESLDYLTRISQGVRHYLGIKTIVSFMTGFLIWIYLLIIGVEYAILWGLIAFLLNYIPNIGSIIAGVPAILFALVQLGFVGALWTTGGFVAVNVIIGNFIEPRMMGKGMGLSTLVVFLSLIFWGYVLGTVGMFLSVPLTMTVKIMLEQNGKTQWIAVLLGTQEDAQAILEKRKE